MKKIFAVLLGLVLSMTAFGACNNNSACDYSCHDSCNNSSDIGGGGKVDIGGENIDGESTLTMIVECDYGLHIQNKTTLLLDGCCLFFNSEDYGITEFVVGDVVTITYKGECYIQESYPGTVVTKDMTILDVTVEKAKILEVEIWDVPGGGYDVIYMDGSIGCDNTYVINEDGTFEELGEKHVGKTLYGADVALTSFVQIKALYSYNPRPDKTTVTPPEDHDHSLVCLEEIEPTCQYDGYVVIGCTWGDYIYEERVLEKVDCQLDEKGKCIWCETQLSNFYTWINELTADNITSMKRDVVTYGVAPGERVDSRVTTVAIEDKETILAYLKNLSLKAVSAKEAQIDGGGGVHLDIYTAEDSYGIRINNGYMFIGGIYYKPSESIPTFGENAVIWMPCCFCGSYDCTGCADEE